MWKAQFLFLATMALSFGLIIGPAFAGQTVVLELFTSQGCFSCPPADALLKRLAADDPSLLPLSFHVHYWDSLGWKDPFSSTDNTARQKTYGSTFGLNGVFTTQLVVDGEKSVVGSNESAVRMVIADAKPSAPGVDVSIRREPSSQVLIVDVANRTGVAVAPPAEVLEILFSPYAQTSVNAGENNGATLVNINNVTEIKQLGALGSDNRQYIIAKSDLGPGGIAIIVQALPQGKVLGAASYKAQ